MKTDIILSGVGGQGILSIAAVIGTAAIDANLFMKQSEVHGMSQRGGAVQSHLRISDQPVESDLIPHGSCDLILSVEPMESLRYLPYLSGKGWVITNANPFKNIDNYPAEEDLFRTIANLPHQRMINADKIAREIGTRKVSNMVMLGASSDKIGLSQEQLKGSLEKIFSRKGQEIINLNLQAFNQGRKEVVKH